MGDDNLGLLQGTLDVLVLRALSFGPLHGYGVASFIREGSDGAFRILDGALYTSLHRMEERGWVTSSWGHAESGKRARFYRLTRAGKRRLRLETDSWSRYVEAVLRVLRPGSV